MTDLQKLQFTMKPVEPIFVTEICARLHAELIALLKGLAASDWDRPTAAGAWTVKDVVAHLLDGDIRRLSCQRDEFPMVRPDAPIAGYRDLVDFLNQLNAAWVSAARRISPRLLIQLHELTGKQVCELFASLDPFGAALFDVAWAGEEAAQNWFDVAREYTEKWHHQQQIRDAVGAPGLTSREWLYPVLDTFLRGLPHTYRNTDAEEGVCISFIITGDAGGEWTIRRENSKWGLYSGKADEAVCCARMTPDTAWRLLTKGLKREQTVRQIKITGKQDLGQPLLGMLAVMA